MVSLIRKGDENKILEIDKTVKNKFKFSWLMQTIKLKVKLNGKEEEVEEKLEDYIAKTDQPGQAQCTYCKELINYGSRGVISLKEHAQKVKHKQHICTHRTNYALSSSGFVNVDPLKSTTKSLTSLVDRKAHSEVIPNNYFHILFI